MMVSQIVTRKTNQNRKKSAKSQKNLRMETRKSFQHNVIFKDESTSNDNSRSKSGERALTPSQRFQRKSLHGIKCKSFIKIEFKHKIYFIISYNN